jgi:hypothetical protein
MRRRWRLEFLGEVLIVRVLDRQDRREYSERQPAEKDGEPSESEWLATKRSRGIDYR